MLQFIGVPKSWIWLSSWTIATTQEIFLDLSVESASPASLPNCRWILYCWTTREALINYTKIITKHQLFFWLHIFFYTFLWFNTFNIRFGENEGSQFSLVLSHVRLFVAPRTAACQASLSLTNSQSLLKLMSMESVMPSDHFILCCPLLLLPSIFPSIRVFPNESVFHIKGGQGLTISFNRLSTKFYVLYQYVLKKWCATLEEIDKENLLVMV